MPSTPFVSPVAVAEFPLGLQRFTEGQQSIEIEARNVRELIEALERRFPELGDRLRSGLAVAIDGDIHNDPYLEPLGRDSEVIFLSSISGG